MENLELRKTSEAYKNLLIIPGVLIFDKVVSSIFKSHLSNRGSNILTLLLLFITLIAIAFSVIKTFIVLAKVKSHNIKVKKEIKNNQPMQTAPVYQKEDIIKSQPGKDINILMDPNGYLINKFNGKDFSNMDFSYLNGFEMRFENCNLKGANFTGAQLRKVSFYYSDLTGACFKDADLSGAILCGANYTNACFDHANMFNADLRKINAPGASFRYVNISRLNFGGSILKNACFFNSGSVSAVDFSNADLEGATLSGMDICDARFEWANLSRANLSSTKFRKCKIYSANLFEADMSKCSLDNVDFSNTDMRRVYAPGCKICNVERRGAKIGGENFDGANFGINHIVEEERFYKDARV